MVILVSTAIHRGSHPWEIIWHREVTSTDRNMPGELGYLRSGTRHVNSPVGDSGRKLLSLPCEYQVEQGRATQPRSRLEKWWEITGDYCCLKSSRLGVVRPWGEGGSQG